MSELRYDPLARRWVIIATERSRKPSEFVRSDAFSSGAHACPFCPGNEHATPPEIMAIRPEGSEPNTPGWTGRVFPNKYPALSIEGDPERQG